MSKDDSFMQDQAVLAHRVGVLEGKVDKIDATQDTIQIHVSRIADALELAARERKSFQREVSSSFKCINETWDKHVAENGPLLSELKEKREDIKAVRKKATLAVVALVVAAAWQSGGDFLKWMFKIKTGS